MRAVLERFEEKILRTPGGCWRWTAARVQDGYGQFKFNGRMVGSHRFAYEQYVGPIPEGLQIDHLCRNRWCVNPLHLEPVTQRENILRGHSPAGLRARASKCQRGHAFDSVNTYYDKGGYRHCRRCAADRAAGRVAK